MKNKIFLLTLIFSIFSINAQNFTDKGKGFTQPTKEEVAVTKKLKANFIGSGDALYETTTKTFGDSKSKKFDLRLVNGVTKIKDQKNCGSCWAFSAAAALESNYALKNNDFIDISEQGILGCSGVGSCATGGWYTDVFAWLLDSTSAYVTTENDFPYQAKDVCQTNFTPIDLKVTNYGMLPNGDINQIKDALVKYGAVSAAVFSNNPDFMNYKSGVITGNNTNQPDHAIAIVGWDDDLQAWLIRNSWSELWGDKGYAWVGYNACSISYGSWVDVSSKDNIQPEPVTKDQIILNFVDQLAKAQAYQEIYIKIDDKEPYRFYMNEQNKKYYNYVPVEKGKHKIQLITKSIIEKNGKNTMIFGVLKGDLEVTNNKSYKIMYDSVIKNNVFNIKIQ